MSLQVCVIDTETGLLYEWNNSKTVNVFESLEYAAGLWSSVSEAPVTQDMWTMSECSDATDFISSVADHIEEQNVPST